MRLIVDKALKGADDVVGRLMKRLEAGNKRSADEQRQRYALLHRGRPLATLDVAMQATQRDPTTARNPLVAGVEYERAMEKLMRES